MIANSRTHASVTEEVIVFIADTYATPENLVVSATELIYQDVTSGYIQFRNSLVNNGYVACELCYIKIFQVITEIMMMCNNSPDPALATDDIIVNIVVDELMSHSMRDYMEDVASILIDVVSYGVGIYDCHVIIGGCDYNVLVPIKWQYNKDSIALLFGVFDYD